MIELLRRVPAGTWNTRWGVCAALCLSWAPAWSATEPADADSVQEIVVTSRKTNERLQDVPMSVSVLGSEQLDKAGTVSLEDLGHEVPGLNIASGGPGQNQITLRGLSGNNTVGLYVDDTPVSLLNAQVAPNNWFMDPAMFDLSRVEVLKGPQGTLYGASSLGGTVRYITNQPDLNEFHFSAKQSLSGTQGGGPNEEFDGLINVPLVDGRLAVRAMLFQRYNDGWIDRYPTDRFNILAVDSGPVDRNVNWENTYGGRIALKAQPIDQFSATLSANYQRMRLGSMSDYDSPPGTLENPIQSRLADDSSSDDSWTYTLTLEGNLDPVHITSVASYFDRAYHAGEDDTKALAYTFPLAGPAPTSQVTSGAWNNNFVDETRATWNWNRLHGIAGFFYSHAVAFGDINWPPLEQYVPLFGDQTIFYGTNKYRDLQRAFFGELNVDITSQLQATVGARTFHQTQTLVNHILGVYAGGVESLVVGEKSASGSTPKYGLSYHITPDVMAYATAQKGFREGGPGYPVPPNCLDDYRALGHPDAGAGTQTSYDPDTIWSYELGGKTSWLDRKLAVDTAGYIIHWKNIQQIIILPCSDTFTGNFGSAISKGVELDVHYDPITALRLAVSGAWNQSQLTATVAGAQGVAGQVLEYAPRWTGNISAEYNRDLTDTYSGFVRASLNTTSHQFTSFDSTSPFYVMPGYSLANLRLGVKHGPWKSSLFVDNFFDKHAITDIYNAYGSNVPTTQPLGINRPRTIGIDVRFDH